MSQLLLVDDYTKDMLEHYTPEKKKLEKISRYFSVFSDVTRLRILSALCVTDMCVTDISRTLSLNQTTASHQLKILKDADIVSPFRQGKIVFYSVDSEKVDKIMLACMEFLKD